MYLDSKCEYFVQDNKVYFVGGDGIKKESFIGKEIIEYIMEYR